MYEFIHNYASTVFTDTIHTPLCYNPGASWIITTGLLRVTHSWPWPWPYADQAAPLHCWWCIRSPRPAASWSLWCRGTPPHLPSHLLTLDKKSNVTYAVHQMEGDSDYWLKVWYLRFGCDTHRSHRQHTLRAQERKNIDSYLDGIVWNIPHIGLGNNGGKHFHEVQYRVLCIINHNATLHEVYKWMFNVMNWVPLLANRYVKKEPK